MFIKYTGPKPVKKVYFTHPKFGGMEYTFNPVCEINDSELSAFLLSPDRKGLFEIVDAPTEPAKAGKTGKDSKETPAPVPSKKAEDVKAPSVADLKQAAKPRAKKSAKKLGAQDAEPAKAEAKV